MNSSFSADTNILFYSIDPADDEKHRIALRIVGALLMREQVIILQVLAELFYSAVRKRLITAQRASQVVADFIERVPVLGAEPADMLLAMELQHLHQFQIFDCIILAVAIRSGCTVFFTEDMQHNRMIDGLLIVNPFKLSPAELDLLLA